jgi:serine O-acetyltransferase
MSLQEIANQLDLLTDDSAIRPHTCGTLAPNRNVVIRIIKELQALLFPGYFHTCGEPDTPTRLATIRELLLAEMTAACSFGEGEDKDPTTCTDQFLSCLPAIKTLLLKDVDALYEGDPAAKCREEVLICYPGFYAISIYRMAHELYKMGIPLLPRIMTEYAHEKTGIDIHAGATIGEYFFIDHGTGIVIGETTVIGHHVKLYQGVTLGAKSFELDEEGNPVKNIKRHPNIGNHVIIYANATILGGNTYVGDGCVIGGNVWLTHSVEAGQTVVYREK